jgi:RNA polymerase sigma-70 factor (ECF subfamily)
MLISRQIDYIKQKLGKYTSDKDLIDELSQVINIKLYEHSYNYRNDNQSKKLISLLVNSTYIDDYRSKKIDKRRKADIPQEPAQNPPYINLDVLFTNIDKLPEKQKDIIILRYYFGLKYSKIAQLLNCSKNTALSHFHKAKINLRKLMTKEQVYS